MYPSGPRLLLQYVKMKPLSSCNMQQFSVYMMLCAVYSCRSNHLKLLLMFCTLDTFIQRIYSITLPTKNVTGQLVELNIPIWKRVFSDCYQDRNKVVSLSMCYCVTIFCDNFSTTDFFKHPSILVPDDLHAWICNSTTIFFQRLLLLVFISSQVDRLKRNNNKIGT